MTSIEWTDAVWNPVVGCSRVSAGCEHCYAERVAHRAMQPAHAGLTVASAKGPRWTGDVRCLPERLDQPLRWRKPRRVFVNSMSDLFHEQVSFEFITAVYGAMAASMQHIFQVLTKRPERSKAWSDWLASKGGLGPFIRSDEGRRALSNLYDHGTRTEVIRGHTYRSSADAWAMVMNAAACVGRGPLLNVHLGVSVEDQATADERIPLLLQTPAAVRFVSYEPALGPVDFERGGWSFLRALHPPPGNRIGWDRGLDWLIVGGESGPGARPCDVEWIRSVVEQCRASSVPCFVKQLGSLPMGVPPGKRAPGEPAGMRWRFLLRNGKGGDPAEWPADLRVREFPEAKL